MELEASYDRDNPPMRSTGASCIRTRDVYMYYRTESKGYTYTGSFSIIFGAQDDMFPQVKLLNTAKSLTYVRLLYGPGDP
jgi:hypothetical protein